MEAITTTTTLWKILNESKIVIPTFQRDYAQGRFGKEDLRKRFLNEIKSSLECGSELLLDFVYGTKKSNIIYPLDGQQRLTTLWVLMWYVTFKSWKSLDDKVKNERKERLRNFTYETRPSSKNFIEWLCSEELLNGTPLGSLSDFIQNQTGFYSGWKQDPTVQSVLRMLSGTQVVNKKTRKIETPFEDGIEQVFNGFEEKLFDRLFINDCPIKFYHLDLLGIKQSDNLYVKMNARGEQLTSFENFKADLVGYLSKKDNLKDFVTLGNTKYILKKWDVDWTDLFWNERGKEDGVDDLFFTFIKRFLLNRYITSDGEKDVMIYKILYDDEQKEYTSFKLYESLINESCINDLIAVLDYAVLDYAVMHNLENLEEILPLLRVKEYNFFPQYDENGNVKSATFHDRVMMYGICLYLQKVGNKGSFNQWLRVLSNLSYYNEIPSFKEYESRLKFINIIVDILDINNLQNVYSKDALNALVDIADNGETENYTQLKEEIEKVKKINDDEKIEELLKDLESLWVFSGRIDCLLDDDLLKVKNLYEIISGLIGENSRYLYNSEELILLFQAILAVTKDDFATSGLKINDEHDNFRKILNGELKEPFQNILKNILKNKSLKTIIAEYEYKKDDDWKYALIKDESLWKYSLGKIGKHGDNDEYYLYKRTYRNEADIPLKAYSKFINEQDKNPINIEYEKGYWKVYYDDEKSVEFCSNNSGINNHGTANDEVLM